MDILSNNNVSCATIFVKQDDGFLDCKHLCESPEDGSRAIGTFLAKDKAFSKNLK